MRTFDTRPAGYTHQWPIKRGPFHGDKFPHMMFLGSRRNHKGNDLVTGMNFNYLTNDEIEAIRKAQPQIQSAGSVRNPEARADVAKQLLPQSIIDKSMRTYSTRGFSAARPPTPGVITPDRDAALAWRERRKAAQAPPPPPPPPEEEEEAEEEEAEEEEEEEEEGRE